MREQLCLIDGMNRFFALDFNDYLILDDQIGPEPAFQFDSVVDNRNWFLSANVET